MSNAHLNDHQNPTTIYEAIDQVIASFNAAELDFVKANDKYAPGIHHGLGTNIRNRWGLWDRKSPIVRWCMDELKIGCADDISGLIITGVWQKVRGETIDLTADIESYRTHWLEHGLDPITQEQLNKPEAQTKQKSESFVFRVGRAIINGILLKP